MTDYSGASISRERDPLGIDGSDDSASIIMRELQRGPTEDYPIIIEPEDTLNLFAEWSGLTVVELLRLNPSVKDSGIVPGQSFNLKLSAGTKSMFKGLRDAYRIKALQKREKGSAIAREVTHVVAEGETLQMIIAGYDTTIDLVEKLNPEVRMLNLRPGDALKIPIVASGKGEVRDRLPGPPAPGPAPVPVPPSRETRKLLVDGPPMIVRDSVPQQKKPVARPVQKRKPYSVKKGDSVRGLCKAMKITAAELAAVNPGVDLKSMRPGQKIYVPKKDSQTVASHP
jgi:LysM repeat protein